MKTKAQMWGNSLAVRIPRHVAQELGLKPDDTIEASVREGRIVLARAAKPRRRLTLDELLPKITKKNLHRAAATGPARGRERVTY